MKIVCLSCGHKVDLDDAYDNYDGPVKCFACRTLLAIRTEAGGLKSVAISTGSPVPADPPVTASPTPPPRALRPQQEAP